MLKQKGIALLLASLLGLSSVAFANHHGEKEATTKEEMKKEMIKKVKPKNIDKNNVSDTSSEKPDQTDPTLIEGNLEKNDFKN